MRQRQYSRLVVFKDTEAVAKALFAQAELEGVSVSEILRRALRRDLETASEGDPSETRN